MNSSKGCRFIEYLLYCNVAGRGHSSTFLNRQPNGSRYRTQTHTDNKFSMREDKGDALTFGQRPKSRGSFWTEISITGNFLPTHLVKWFN